MKQTQAPAAEPEPPAVTFRTVTVGWSGLAINGENWRDKLAEIPPGERSSMAIELLEQGRFRCDPVQGEECLQHQTLRVPDAASDINDPCLRRELALWAVSQLSDEQIYAHFDLMTALVWVPPPEQALASAVLDRFRTGFEAASLRWEAEAAGHEHLPPFDFAGALDHEEMVKAATELHLDGAVLALDPVEDMDVYVEALGDPELLPETQLAMMDRLVAHLDRMDDEARLKASDGLYSLRYSHDCTLATAAITTAARFTSGHTMLPRGPFTDQESLISATCATLAMGVRGQDWKQLITKHGLEVTSEREDPFRVDALWTKYPFAFDEDLDGAPDVPEADPDGDGNVANTVESSTKPWSKRFTLPYADELKLALPHCEGNICKVPSSDVWFELDIQKERGTKLRLRGIERHEKVGTDC